MQVNDVIINLNSPNPERLAEFYRDKVGLPQLEGMGPTAFRAGPAAFIIDGHSEVNGPAEQPARWLFNLRVPDVQAEQERMKQAGVKFIRELGQEYWGGVISTFVDPDGNYVQLINWQDQAS
ncbi:MAG: VOC family protein [Hyphomicrobiales bacterium]